jgi:hypothetical protein
MPMTIKPGFLLKITTWENDGDNYNTLDLAGLSEDHVSFFLRVANLFQSYNRHGDGKFGNNEVNDDATGTAIDAIVAEFKANNREVPIDWDKELYPDKEWLAEYCDGFYNDHIYELIGIWCEGERYRVFDSFKVFHVPAALEDVTHKFRG